MAKTLVKMNLNGRDVERLVEPRTLLIHFLREQLDLTGTQIGCDTTHRGACTIDVNGKSVKGCTMFTVQAEGTGRAAALAARPAFARQRAFRVASTGKWDRIADSSRIVLTAAG